MKTIRISVVVFFLSLLCFIGYLVWSAPELPDRVASHFGWAGQADGWMSHASYITFVASMGLGMPCFLAGLFFVIRFFPNGAFNLPNRDYWLAPERRAETMAYLFGSSLWFASLFVGFFAGLHFLTVQANRQAADVARLSMPMFIAMTSCFLLGTLVWGVFIFRHFNKDV